MERLRAHLENYSDLLIRVGLNLQPGQKLFIGTPSVPTYVEHAYLARMVAERAYAAGARKVHVLWQDPQITRLDVERAPADALDEFPMHLAQWAEEAAADNAAFAVLLGEDPNLFAGVDPARIGRAMRARNNAVAGWRAYTMSSKVSWCIAGAPSSGWAAQMLPEVPAEKRLEAQWEYILRACRMYEPDPMAAWQSHLTTMRAKSEELNSRRYRRLHYKGPGTDLTIDLPERHTWLTIGGSANARGTPFCPNLPSEEIFTVPHKDGVNGVVQSTMPLNYAGSLIEGLKLRFEGGRIIDFSAEKGQEVLRSLYDTDEGARRLGEVALVPVDSPISRMNRLFYNTLFDENASCHLATGRGYPNTLEGGTSMSRQELAGHGVNFSDTHIDFMIGSTELDIDGETATGERVPVMRKGRWAD